MDRGRTGDPEPQPIQNQRHEPADTAYQDKDHDLP